MTGLLLLLVGGLWGWLCLKIAHRVSRRIPQPALRAAAKAALLVVLLPLPLADEIYSRHAFTRLCQSEAGLVLLDQQLAGKTIWFTGARSLPRKIGLLQGREERWTYVVAENEAPAFHHSSFHVRGGWLMTALHISQTGGPLLLPSQCNPVDLAQLPARLNVTIADKPAR